MTTAEASIDTLGDTKLIDELESPWQNKEVLEKLYIDLGLSSRKIADELGCGNTTVSKWLRRHDIETRDRGERSPSHTQEKPWTSKSTLEKLYNKQELSSTEIAKKFDCDPQTILNWLEIHDIERRDWYNRAPSELRSERWLVDKYCRERLSTNQIGDILGCSHNAVSRALREFEIEVRGSLPSGPENPQYDRKEINCDTCGAIIERAESHININNFCDKKCLAEWNSDKLSGEGSPRWTGGYERYYGPNWVQQRKEAIKRDQARCQDCGMTEQTHIKSHGTRLHVHHITPARCFDDPQKRNDLENLITLCEQCHLGKWEPMAPLRPDSRSIAD